jgi:hypothetical protein
MRFRGIFRTLLNLWPKLLPCQSLCLCLFFSLNSFSQPNLTLPPYRQYTLRDGLSQMQVICMIQDSRGYIWIGTKSGLCCFDGEGFKNYTAKKYPEILNDFIASIKEDSFGRIWASTPSGIFRIDGDHVRYFRMNNNPDASISPGKNGRLWFCQSHYPEPEYNIGYIENDSVCFLSMDLPDRKAFTTRVIHYFEPEDVLLLASDSTLYALKNNRFETLDHSNGPLLLVTVSNQKANYLKTSGSKEWGNNKMWDSEVKKYENGKTVSLASVINGKYTGKTTLCDTVFYIQPIPIQIYALLTPDSVHNNFNQGVQLSAMLFDHDGHLWMGSEEGVYQVFDNGFTVFKKELLPQIWAVTEDAKGTFWFSSYLNGFYTLKNGIISHYPNYFIRNAGYPYFHPSRDRRGRLFFPDAHGILMVDGNHFQQITERLFLTTWYDADRDLIWGGVLKKAIAFNSGMKVVRTIDENNGLNVGKYVLTIGRDTSGYYWLGGGNGLARYNWETGKLKNYNPGGRKWGVPTQCTDFKGRTWFGSKGGLLWYDARHDSLVRIDREELSDVVNMVGTIDSTWLIASQPFGIYLMDLQHYYRSGEVELHLFNGKNGFLGEEPGQDGAFSDSKGNVWMTSGTEVIKLDPRKLKTVKYSLNIRISKCNGKDLPFSSQEIRLPRNQNSAVLTFNAICFNRPTPVQYSWKLDRDTAWSAWQQEDYAVIPGLNDGNHQLFVRAKVTGLVLEKPAETSVRLIVRMALYRQNWFLPTLFVLISFTGMIFLILSILRTRQAGREARISQAQAIQSQMNPHFIFNVLASLQTMILKADISKANDYLVKLADLVRGFLEASAGSGSLKSPRSEEGLVNLSSELKLLTEFVEFQQEINPGRFQFRLEIDPGIDSGQQKIPPMLIQPFIENAIRHGLLPSERDGLLLLKIGKEGKELKIYISDNGIGMEKSAELNRRSQFRYHSRGQELTLKRIELLNKLGFRIHTKAQSDQNGTNITISIIL